MSHGKRSHLDVSADALTISFEFFPPKTAKMEETLWQSIRRLEPLAPNFVSVTYGAGGSTRERTHNTVAKLVSDTSLKPAAHLTCVSATKDEVDDVIRSYHEAGVNHIVALRGDPPEGIGTAYTPHPGGYQSSVELIKGIKAISDDFEISVSAYPEKHPESASIDADIELLKAKIDAGATRAITQFFFDNDHYYRYMDKIRAAGITIPIIPGIIPILNFKTMTKFAASSGATVPPWLSARYEGLDEDPQTAKLVSAAIAVEQVMDLVDEGIRDLHFYTLNRADLVYAICHMLGFRPVNHAKN
ncbi:MAG: methylenetetrahydrofolate reductase [Rhodomicrobium sp.]|nr:MAG: methylenetetrahydrofolate reductase [Rhodomicrobium sp.]